MELESWTLEEWFNSSLVFFFFLSEREKKDGALCVPFFTDLSYGRELRSRKQKNQKTLHSSLLSNVGMDQMQQDQSTQKLIDYDVIRGEVFQVIVKQHSIASFHEYWNDFGSFILGRLSKSEFDATVLKLLTAKNGKHKN